MKTTKTTLADAIANYVESHDVSNEYKRSIFANCAHILEQTLVEAKEKQDRDFIQVPKSSILRNHTPFDAVMRLGVIEMVAVVLIEDEGMEPLEAVERACVLCPPIS
jgi:hypothetical protein